MNPKLIVEQKITAFANKYRIFGVGSGGEKGDLLAFAQQKRLAFKEKVTFYGDEQKSNEIFSFRAEKVMDVHGRYFVEDSGGQQIGAFRKDFKKSLTSSTWHVLDENGQAKITISESNPALAIFRRFAGFIPIIGGLAEIITVFFKYHFVLTDNSSGQPIGKYQKTKLIRDHYQLSMDEPSYKKTDWRVLAAVSVALDALQSR